MPISNDFAQSLVSGYSDWKQQQPEPEPPQQPEKSWGERAKDDIINTVESYITGAQQGFNEMQRAQQQQDDQLYNTAINGQRPTFDQAQQTQDYVTDAQRQFVQGAVEPVVMPAAMVVPPLAPVAGTLFAADMAKEAKDEGVGQALRSATYGPAVDFATQDNLGQQFYDRPVSTIGNAAMSLVPAALLAKGGYSLAKKVPAPNELSAMVEQRLNTGFDEATPEYIKPVHGLDALDQVDSPTHGFRPATPDEMTQWNAGQQARTQANVQNEVDSLRQIRNNQYGSVFDQQPQPRFDGDTALADMPQRAQSEAVSPLANVLNRAGQQKWDEAGRQFGIEPPTPEPVQRSAFQAQPEYNRTMEHNGIVQDLMNNGVEQSLADKMTTNILNKMNNNTVHNDPITGYLKNEYRNPTLERAWQEHENTGRDFSYADIDFSNLGGLNAHTGANSLADAHLRNVADIVKQTIADHKIDNAQLFRHGGDEWSVLAPDIPKNILDNALQDASIRVRDYATQNGLDQIYHPKLHQNTGIGIYHGVSDMRGSNGIERLIIDAERGTSKGKNNLKGGQRDVNRVIPETIQSVAPEGRSTVIASGIGQDGQGNRNIETYTRGNGSTKTGLDSQRGIPRSGQIEYARTPSANAGGFSMTENMKAEALHKAYEAAGNSDYKTAFEYAKQTGDPKTIEAFQKLYSTDGGTVPTPPNLDGKVKGSYTEPTITKKQFVDRTKELFLPIRTGRIGKAGVEGFVNHDTGIIRARNYGDFDVLAHEVGHTVDAALGLRKYAGSFDGEFNKVINERFPKGAYEPEQIRAEGIAEFMRDYALNPERAKQSFPNYYRAFETELAKNPDLQGRVNEFRDMAQAWVNQSPEMRGSGSISYANDREKSMTERAKDGYYNFKEKMIDDKTGLDKVVSEYEKTTGEKLTTEDNPYLMARLANNSAVARAQMLVDGKSPEMVKDALNKSYGNVIDNPVTMKSILDGLKDPSIVDYVKRTGYENNIKALDNVLTARRQLELQSIYPEYKGPMSKADAEAIVNNAPAKLHDLAEQCYQYNDNILRILTHEGMIKQEVYDELTTKYKNYVPMARDFADEAAMERGLGMGKGFANVRSALKSISEEGSTRQVISPLESMMKNTYVALNLVERNRVGKTFAKLAEGEKVGRLVEEVTGNVNAKDSTFSVWINGEKRVYQTDPSIYRAIMSMNQESSNMLWNILAKPASWLRAGATVTPDFAIKNFVRDTFSAMIYSRYGFVPFVDHFRGLSSYLKQDALYHEYQSSGALMSTMVGLDRNYTYESMKRLFKGDTAWQKYNPLHLMRALSEAIETSTRLGEYGKARSKGASMADAALSARDITLDFSKAGTWGRRINQITAFFNAAVQEPVRLGKAFRENPKGTSAKIGAYIVTPSVVLWAMNHDQDWYKELPSYQKDLFWILGKTPSWVDPMYRDNVVRIPKPFGVGVLFGSGTERMLDYFADKDPQSMKRWASSALDAFMPNIMPTVATPILEWKSNYSMFLDRNVVPQREEKLPNHLQYGPDTSELAKDIGKFFDLSPRKIDSVIYSMGGGLARQTLNTADAIAGKRDYKNPFGAAFTVDPYKSPQSIQDFYDKLGELEKQANGNKLTKEKPDAIFARNHNTMTKANDIMRNLNKQEREVLQSNLPSEQKSAKVQAINKQQVQLAQAALKQLK